MQSMCRACSDVFIRHDFSYRPGDTAADILSRLKHLPPAFEMREQWHYNNHVRPLNRAMLIERLSSGPVGVYGRRTSGVQTGQHFVPKLRRLADLCAPTHVLDVVLSFCSCKNRPAYPDLDDRFAPDPLCVLGRGSRALRWCGRHHLQRGRYGSAHVL